LKLFAIGSLESFCEHGDGPSGSVKQGISCDQLKTKKANHRNVGSIFHPDNEERSTKRFP